MSSIEYISSKLSDALYILTVHEGDARTRLAKAWPKLKVLSVSSFPSELQKDFDWVKSTIQKGIGIHSPEFPVDKLTGIHNSTASKVIKKIVYLEDKIELQLEKEMEKFS